MELNGKLNKCGVIRYEPLLPGWASHVPREDRRRPPRARGARRFSDGEPRVPLLPSPSPRYDLSHKDIETWIGRLLPSRQVRSRLLEAPMSIIPCRAP